MKPDFRVRRLKPTSINVAPVTVKSIKKELIEINGNTYAETVKISDILKDFEHPTICEDPIIDNSKSCDISMILENSLVYKDPLIIIEQENCDSSLDLEPTAVNEECEECETSQNVEHSVDEEKDCFILESKQQPIVVEEGDSEVCSESEMSLVIDEEESYSLKKLQQPFIKQEQINHPLKTEQVDSHKEPSVIINKNNNSEKHTKETVQKNTTTIKYGPMVRDCSPISENENLSPTNDISIRTGRSHLGPFDFGTHQAGPNNVYPTEETSDMATYVVPFGHGMQKLNTCSSSLNESQKQTKKRGRKKKEVLLNDAHRDYYFCDICYNSFISRFRLKSHVKRMHPDEKVHSCNICDKFFNKFCDLKDHFKRKHVGEKLLYPCDRCRKKYKSSKHLLLHKKLSHPEPIKMYSCDVCNKSYVQRLSYKYHVLFVHPQISYSDIL